MAHDGHEALQSGRKGLDVMPEPQDLTRLVGTIRQRLATHGLIDFSMFGDERNKRARGVFCRTVPNDWQVHYIAMEYNQIDPVAQHLRVAKGPFTWSSLDRAAMTPAQRRIFEEAREIFGFRDGVAVPLPLPYNELAGFATFSLLEQVPDSVLEHVGVIARQALAAFVQLRRGMLPDQRPLTRRENQVLRWAAEGKSNTEIAMILALAEKTIEYHWTSIRRKLGATNRTMAVAIAVANSLLRPDPSR